MKTKSLLQKKKKLWMLKKICYLKYNYTKNWILKRNSFSKKKNNQTLLKRNCLKYIKTAFFMYTVKIIVQVNSFKICWNSFLKFFKVNVQAKKTVWQTLYYFNKYKIVFIFCFLYFSSFITRIALISRHNSFTKL